MLLNPHDAADQQTLVDACRAHPRAVEKGLDKVDRVELNAEGNGYIAVLQDGRHETFSKKHVGSKRRRPNAARNKRRSDAIEAFRNEVLQQTRGHRLATGHGGDGEATHVGHVGPTEFRDIVTLFCAKRGIQDAGCIPLEKRLQRSHHAHKHWYLQDVHLAADWREFHQRHAQLEMQTAQENLRRTSSTTTAAAAAAAKGDERMPKRLRL